MTQRAAALCPHCKQETYLLAAKEQPTAVQPIGKGVRFVPATGALHWNCAGCGAEHILTYDLAKSGATRTPHLQTLPPVIPTLPIR